MLQSTLPVYLAEISPVQLRGFFINAYTLYVPSKVASIVTIKLLQLCSWFVLGQLFASVALNELQRVNPYNFRTAIYTQVIIGKDSTL